MTLRIETYSIGELARAAGISVRTLHHYDAIGLLKPAYVAANGYRHYREQEALRLQEILFYRSTGLSLANIAKVIDQSDRVGRLEAHREKLRAGIVGQAQMLVTLDRTIAHLKGQGTMTLEDLYTPFSAETQAGYEAWLIATYGAAMAGEIKSSKARRDVAPETGEVDLHDLRKIEADLVAAYEAGKSAETIDLSAHQAWVARMWGKTCDAKAYTGLADLYLSHPDFIARYETLSQGFSQWLPQAMKAWTRGRWS